MLESEIVCKIKAYLKSVEGCFFWKEHGGQFGSSGIPDLIVCYRGRFIAFGVKTKTGKPTALQQVMIKRILSAGGYATVVRSVEEVKAVIEAFRLER